MGLYLNIGNEGFRISRNSEYVDKSELIKHVMGRAEIADMHIVSGGLMGRMGDFVVDHITNPRSVLGIADGHGSFIHEYDYTDDERKCVTQLRNIIEKG